MGLNKTLATMRMFGQNINKFIPKHDRESIPTCSHCGEELDGPTTNGLHDKCKEELYNDIEIEYPEFFE